MNVFDVLSGGVIGEVTQNGVTYATAPTPPAGDDSTKVATTAFVADNMPSIPSGNVAVWSRDFTNSPSYPYNLCIYAPAGGSWFCWGTYELLSSNGVAVRNVITTGRVYSGGSLVGRSEDDYYPGSTSTQNHMMAIKIA